MTDQGKGMLLAFAGILVLSPDTLLVRLLDMPQWDLQVWRGLGQCGGIGLGVAAVYGASTFAVFRAVGRWGLLASVAQGAASILFVNALYLTSVANVLALISTAPLFGALMSRFLLGERLAARTWGACLLGMAAIGIIVGGDVGGEGSHLAGDLVALAQAACMAGAFVLVRKRAEVNMLPCMVISGALVALFSMAQGGGVVVPVDKLPLLVLLCFGVLAVSFGMLFLAPRYIPSPEVNLIMLLEMVLGPLLVWWVVGETVPPATMIGGGLLFATLAFHSWLGLHSVRRARRLARAAGG
ncbi:DMT family transporter [Desulfohalovibrio reitneri]|uniref:DMT family transporter n=1 Tax=Desulfohalovibrio reitneri TaxID=1307759 RepID=UPI0004A77846|nr:DMT family transporter [Desulfohalovibrio reitneri]